MVKYLLNIFLILPIGVFAQSIVFTKFDTINLICKPPIVSVGEFVSVQMAYRYDKFNLRDCFGIKIDIHSFKDTFALYKGKNIIPESIIELCGRKFIGEKCYYYVLDSIPKANEGVWMHQIKLSDSTMYLRIEQLIPVSREILNLSDKERGLKLLELPIKLNCDDFGQLLIKDIQMLEAPLEMSLFKNDERIDKLVYKSTRGYYLEFPKVKIIPIFKNTDFSNLPKDYDLSIVTLE